MLNRRIDSMDFFLKTMYVVNKQTIKKMAVAYVTVSTTFPIMVL